jgi:undecaprenyl diphosphate synthase
MEVPAVSIDDDRLPRHIAIVMDGNGRWAKKRFLPRTAGHRAGVAAVRKVIECCLKRRIGALTLFAFSSENWRRPPQEVSLLMELFLTTLERETEKLHENGVRLRVIGDRAAFSPALQERIAAAERLTSENAQLNLAIAANYGGRWDILQATRALIEQVARGDLYPEDIGADIFKSQLALADLPEPDLFIRTGGEQRVSNFLLWQLAYTELYFTSTLWPDFDDQSLDLALNDYANRQRRFGYTSEQVEDLVSENVCTKTSEFR